METSDGNQSTLRCEQCDDTGWVPYGATSYTLCGLCTERRQLENRRILMDGGSIGMSMRLDGSTEFTKTVNGVTSIRAKLPPRELS